LRFNSRNPLVIVRNKATEKDWDQIHIISAGMDGMNPSEDMCKFRAKLNAIIIRFMMMNKINPNSVNPFIVDFHYRISVLAEKCTEGQKSVPAGFAVNQGNATSKSFSEVPRVIARLTASELNEAQKRYEKKFVDVVHSQIQTPCRKRTRKI